jgi:3-oxoacyl-(acyl-carrier-protein) synthase
MKKALGAELDRIAVAPIKGQIGNLGAGVGVDAAAAVLAIQTGNVPPAINTKRTIDGAKLNTSPTARDLKPKVAVSSVYALGGQNAALVFREV